MKSNCRNITYLLFVDRRFSMYEMLNFTSEVGNHWFE